MCFIMRSSFFIFIYFFRFNANNHNIDEARIFSYINAKIDNYDVDILEKGLKENLGKVKVEFSINLCGDNCVSRTRLIEFRDDDLFYNSIFMIARS